MPPAPRRRVGPTTSVTLYRRGGRRAAVAKALGLAIVVGVVVAAVSSCGTSLNTKPGSTLLGTRVIYREPSGVPAPSSTKPSIVFVLTDDLSLDLLRFMPHVLAMEREGLTFKNYFVSDSLCCPSRASIFTGNYPHDTHVFSNSGRHGGYRVFYNRGEEWHTFAVALQRAGYLTGMMGKYLNGYLQFGTHHADGGAADVSPSYVPPGWSTWDVAGWGYPEFNYDLNSNGSVYHFANHPFDYLTDVMAQRGSQFIQAAAERHQAFFLELATFAPHRPYVPAPRNVRDFPGLRAPEPPSYDALPSHAPHWLGVHPPLNARQAAVIDYVFRRRAQSVEAVDRMIGQIEQTLKATGMARNTYVIFSSDNGLHDGQYRLMPGKLTAFDTDIHVPLVVMGPGVRPGSTTSEVAENIDLAKTFAAIGGTTLPSDGHSLMPLLRGQTPPDWSDAALIEHRNARRSQEGADIQQKASGTPTPYEAMRTPGFLYVEYSDGEREFYDVRTDPFELHNIAGLLTRTQLGLLHVALLAMKNCHDGTACWTAAHVPLGALAGAGIPGA
jgi:N-acetylglucosamine-6-sulfatase